MTSVDLFLSYRRSDRESVEKVRQILNALAISTFVDYRDLVPGLPWPQALEQALRNVRAVAVFVGPELGAWQKHEMYFALDRQAEEARAGRTFPVIPVLLPGADLTAGFLFLNTWVDLREDLTSQDSVNQLLKAIRGDTAPEAGDVGAALCPYQGLKAFREEHAAFFFGREEFSRRLLGKVLSESGLVTVIGASGSGKSSIVLSGLMPLLRRQRPPAKTWDTVSFTPGNRPFHRLAGALIPLLEPAIASETERLSKTQELGEKLASGMLIADVVERIIEKSKGTDRLLIVVDQFEEIVTLTPELERSSFVKAMIAAIGHAPLEFVLTLRADYYGHAITLCRELSDRLEHGIVNVGAMTPDEIESAIVKPAKKVGLDFEPGLVHRLLDDLGQEPGRLPLLQFALTELWKRRHGRLMTHAAYEEFGGLTKAITHSAQAELAKFTPEQQLFIRQIFTRLVRVGLPGQGGEDTRQRIFLNEIGAAARPLVDSLAKARLLVTARDDASGDETVEVSHEALIQGWSDLRMWLNEDREFLLWRQRLKLALSEWQRINRDEEVLLRGALLTEAERWKMSRDADLNEQEREFVGLSSEHHRKDDLEQEKQRRRRLVSLVAGLVVMSALAALAALQWHRAANDRRIAQARTLLSPAVLIASTESSRFDQAALLAIESLRLDDTAEAKSILRQAVGLLPKQLAQFQIDCDGRVTFSSNGRFLACLDKKNRSAKIISVSEGKELTSPPITENQEISMAAASPDGKFLAIGFSGAGFKVFDTQTRRIAISGSEGSDAVVAFSASGKYFAAASLGPASRSTIRLFSLQDEPAQVQQLQIDSPVLALTFSPDGGFLAALHQGHPDTEVTIFDLTSRQSRAIRGGAAMPNLALSAGASLVALPYLDNTVRVKATGTYDAAGSKLVHQQLAYALALSADGKYAASGSEDGTARVIETGTGRPIALIPVASPVTSLAFNEGNNLVLVSGDKTVRTIDVLKRPAFESLAVTGAIGISPRGRYLTAFGGPSSSELTIVERRTGEKRFNLSVPPDLVTSGIIRYSLDEESLVAIGSSEGMTVYEVATGKIHRRPALPGLVAEAVSGDGKTVGWATASNIEVFTTDDSRRDRLDFPNIHLLELSPDGRLVAASGKEPTLAVFDVATKKKAFDVQSEARIIKAAFSADGRYLAVASENRTLILSDVRTGKAVWQIKDVDSTLLLFSHDGSILAMGGGDGQSVFDIHLLESTTAKTLFQFPTQAQPVGAAFSLDGRYLDILDDTSVSRQYLRAEDLIEQTCALLTRNLRIDEWNTLMAGNVYHRTCPNLPQP